MDAQSTDKKSCFLSTYMYMEIFLFKVRQCTCHMMHILDKTIMYNKKFPKLQKLSQQHQLKSHKNPKAIIFLFFVLPIFSATSKGWRTK